MAVTCLFVSQACRRSTRLRSSLLGFPLQRSSNIEQLFEMRTQVSSPARKDSCLPEFRSDVGCRHRGGLSFMTASAEAAANFNQSEKLEFCSHRCSLQRRYSRAGALSSLEESQDSVIQGRINQRALVSEIADGLENETERQSTRQKLKTSRHQKEVCEEALSSAVSKNHYGYSQGADETSETVLDFAAGDSSIKPLSLESLGFTDDDVQIEEPQTTPAESHKRQRTTFVRKQKRISNKIESAKGDAPSTDVASEVIVQPVHASPEEMKEAALEASSVLAEVAGIKPFFKKDATKQVSSTGDHVAQHFIKLGEDGPNVTGTEVVTNTPLKAGSDEAEKLWSRHPWSEWVEFLKFLRSNSFFEGSEQWADEGKSIFETYSLVRHATIGFGRERNDIFRSLTQKDLRVLANFGCPDTERKASNASKRLRAHLDIVEGEVCLRCKFKMSCPRAFLKPVTKFPVGTLDVVRLLTGFAGNASPDAELFTSYPKEVELSARNILKEILAFGAMPRDPTFPQDIPSEPAVEKPSLESSPRRPLTFTAPEKPGDWVCKNCDYMNFARNKVCLECRVSRPRQEQEILLGDWECSKCRFLNFSKNLVCRECKTKRPTRVQWTGGDRLPENYNVEKSKGGHSWGSTDKRIRSDKEDDNSSAHLSRSRSKSFREETEDDTEISDVESETESDEEDVDILRSCASATKGRDFKKQRLQEKGKTCVKSNDKSRSSRTWKPNLTKREVTMRRDGEQDYEASDEDADNTDMDCSIDSLEVQDTESEIDLSDEEDEALLPSSSKTRRRVKSAAFSFSEDDRKRKTARTETQSNTRLMSSKTLHKRTEKRGEKGTTRASKPSRGKTGKSLLNEADSDSESFNHSSSKVRSGKPKAEQSSLTNRRKLRAAGRSSFNSLEDESSKLPNSATTMGSKPLFNWSDSESDESDRGSKKHSEVKTVKGGQIKSKSERRADQSVAKTFAHHPQKIGSGGKGRKSKR